MNFRTPVTAAAALAALALLAACSAAPQTAADSADVRPAAFTTDTPPAASPQRTISAVGTGVASGTPDTLTVQLGVQTVAASAGDALADNNAKAATLIETLTAQGVAEKDITTSELSVYPQYSQDGAKISGYQVTNSVTAVLRDVDKAGAVIDAAARAAGDAIRLNQVGFSFADDSELRAEARATAVKNALAQAKQMADAASVSLGDVVSITESPVINSPQPMFGMPVADSAAGSMPISAGQQDLTVSVQVMVAIGG